MDLDTLQPEADRTARREAAGQIPTKRYDPGEDRDDAPPAQPLPPQLVEERRLQHVADAPLRGGDADVE